MMKVIVALDIGSSSVRCTAYSLSGSTISAIPNCSATIQVRSVQPNTGKIRLSSGEDTLFDKIDSCVDEVISQLRVSGAFQVVAVGFSSFVMNLIALDANGDVLGEEFTMTYACNTPEVAQECQSIRMKVGEEGLEQLYNQTGAPVHSAYALAQLRQMHNAAPGDNWNRIYRWTTLSSYCLSRWTGTSFCPISFSEASWTGLLNFRDCIYDRDAIELLPPNCRETLPDLLDFTESIPGLPARTPTGQENRFWSLWPELRDAHFFLGVGDGACANIGSKCATQARIAVTIGTSAAARVCLTEGTGVSCSLTSVPKGLFCYRIDRNHLLVGGALTDGGSIVEWASQLLNLSTKESFLECLKKAQDLDDHQFQETFTQDARNVVTIPFLSGERSTGFRDGASGAIMGLTRATTPAHFLRSCLEGVSLRLRAIVQLILEARQNGENSDSLQMDKPFILASGKSLEVNELWRQMVSDCTGLKLFLDLDTHEGTSRGVARLILNTITNKGDNGKVTYEEEDLISFKQSKPRPAARAYYDRVAEAQNEFIDVMSPMYSNS